MARLSDAAALCALDPPTPNAAMSPEMPGAPEVVRCAMKCKKMMDSTLRKQAVTRLIDEFLMF